MFKLFSRTQKPEDLDKKLVFSLTSARLPRLGQLKLLMRVLDIREQWIVRSAVAVLLLIVAAVFGRAIAPHIRAVPIFGGTYREALIGTPRFINPILAASDVDRDLTRLIYAGLLRYNEQGELGPDLAREFSVGEQGTSITFVLRDNLVWHDGEPLTVEDAKFTIDSIKNQAWRSPLWRGLQDVTATITDPHTLLVKSKAVSASFPHLFTFGILPKHIWEDVDPNAARLAVWNVKPVGAGPFQFASLSKSRDGALSSYRLKRFPRYFDGAPFLKEVALQFYPDFESALEALRQHTVDGVSFLPERLRDKIPGAGVKKLHPEFPRFTALFFQDRKSEILRDGAVRRALAVALDREELADLASDAQPAYVPFLASQLGFAKTLSVKDGNIDEARRMLEAGGWKREKDGWIKNKKYLEVTLTVLDDQSALKVADAIKRTWEELGARVKLEAAAKVAFEHDVLRPRAYEILLFSFVTGADPDPYPFWHSSQIDDPGLNLSSVKSRAIDAALEKGRATTEIKARFRHYLEFQTLLFEESPAVVLYSSPYAYAMANRVRGVAIEFMSVPADRLNGIAKWFVRSRPGWR